MKSLLSLFRNEKKEPKEDRSNIINIRDIIIIPKTDNTNLTTNIREVVYSIIDRYSIMKFLFGYKKYSIGVSNQIKKGATASEAYGIWKDHLFPKIETPFNLPRQKNNPICPKNVLLIQIECINKYTPNMGSWWGFEGYILNILFDIDENKIWDARGEKAK